MKKQIIITFTGLILSLVVYGQSNCPKGISNKDFKAFVKVIESTEFTDTRLQLCQGFVKENCVSVKQVVALLDFFQLEKQKAEVAKAAYANVVDKENFRSIYLKFKQEIYIREIETFVQSQN
ncbi:DUF4476 domain-containing protein [Cyclobacteriaceae bacterium]|nr:DUF4476 domain-containing protein [Cyclobacteriaceae bacterium]